MAEETTNKKIKRRDQVSELLKTELALLIKQAGYNKNVDEELREFAYIGGGAKEGISDTKIKWVLDNGIIPREDFIYALATIKVQLRGINYYQKLGINDPIKYELDHFFSLCGYSITPGSVFPVSSKFRNTFLTPIKSEQYLSAIPNIFWNMTIPFEEIIRYFFDEIRYSEQCITMDNSSHMMFGAYNYGEGSASRILTPVSFDWDSTPDAFRFRIENNNKQLQFKSIEAIRQHNNAIVLVILINGNWIEITNNLWTYGDYSENDLKICNYFNASNLSWADLFFSQNREYIDGEFKSVLTMPKLYEKLARNHNYSEAHKRLTFTKNI